MSAQYLVRGRRLYAALAACALFGVVSTGNAAPLDELAKTLTIDKAQISISGISSGGFMAHQFHVAHSAHITGAGIVAGGPYNCSRGDMVTAIRACSKWLELQCQGMINMFVPFDQSLCASGYIGPKTNAGSLNLAELSFHSALLADKQGQIDDLGNLSRASVYLFTGMLDEIVPYHVMNAVYHFYADRNKGGADVDKIVLNRQFRAHHTMVTDNFYGVHDLGNCPSAALFGDPYISDCKRTAEEMKKDSDCSCRDGGQMCRPTATDRAACTPTSDTENFNPLTEWPNGTVCARNVRIESCRDAGDVDLSGAMLRHIYPDISATSRSSLLGSQSVQPSDTATSELLSEQVAQFSQADLIRHAFAQSDQQAWASLADYGYVYIPESCSAGTVCRLHVALHGCKQGGETDWPYGNKFAKFAGYNEWARNNRIVVLYPQVMPSTLGPLNPEGCWDWWGYTGQDFHTRNGRQVQAVAQMINVLVHERLLPVPAAH